MPAREEIKKRLRQADYKSLAQQLFNQSFDNLSSTQYTELLKIADIYGSKYTQFYKLKENQDIRTITSNLNDKNYQPIFDVHQDLQVIGISKTEESFTIHSQFFTSHEDWVPSPTNPNIKTRQTITTRRAMTIRKLPENDYLLLSIDPIGEGAAVSRDIPGYLDQLAEIVQLDFRDFFDIKEIDGAIHSLVTNEVLIPRTIRSREPNTNRERSVIARAANDNIRDENIYQNTAAGDLDLESLRLYFQGTHGKKETVEIYGRTLLKIRTNANKEKTDELTTHIIQVL